MNSKKFKIYILIVLLFTGITVGPAFQFAHDLKDTVIISLIMLVFYSVLGGFILIGHMLLTGQKFPKFITEKIDAFNRKADSWGESIDSSVAKGIDKSIGVMSHVFKFILGIAMLFGILFVLVKLVQFIWFI